MVAATELSKILKRILKSSVYKYKQMLNYLTEKKKPEARGEGSSLVLMS